MPRSSRRGSRSQNRTAAVPDSASCAGKGARYSGLRLLDGTLVLRVSRGRETGLIAVIDGAAFDPALSGLEVRMRQGEPAHGGWVCLKSLKSIVLHEGGGVRPRGRAMRDRKEADPVRAKRLRRISPWRVVGLGAVC